LSTNLAFLTPKTQLPNETLIVNHQLEKAFSYVSVAASHLNLAMKNKISMNEVIRQSTFIANRGHHNLLEIS
jgi:hypothetical protein